MRKSSGVLYLVSAVVLAVGISACRPSEADRLMKQLNLELENRQQYIAEFEKSLDSLTAQAAQTGDDSLRWFFYDCLRKEYYYYNVDSSAVYVDKMSHLAKNSGRADWQAIAIVAQADISYSRFDYSSALNLFESVVFHISVCLINFLKICTCRALEDLEVELVKSCQHVVKYFCLKMLVFQPCCICREEV